MQKNSAALVPAINEIPVKDIPIGPDRLKELEKRLGKPCGRKAGPRKSNRGVMQRQAHEKAEVASRQWLAVTLLVMLALVWVAQCFLGLK